jgi:hypothetical protein
VQVDRFTGKATPLGIAAPTPEKSPAQVLAEFVQQNPDALIKGTPANQKYEELAEGMRAFPSQQAEIHANAAVYVGRLGVQRAIIQANGLIRAMQGRNIGEQSMAQAKAVNDEIEAATKSWADYYVQHPYLQSMGIGPDAAGQAQFLASAMEQLQSIALESNQLTQKIPGSAQVVPTKSQVPIIGPAANSAGRGKVATQAHVATYARQKGISLQQAQQEFQQAGWTVK